MKITVFDKHFARQGTLGAATKVDFTEVCNGTGTATVTIPPSRPRVSAALQPGSRLMIESEYGVFSGRVVSRGGSGPGPAEVTLTVADDWRLFTRLLGWPNPTASLNSQTSDYRRYYGSAETILKGAVREAVARSGAPVTVAPDLGRGAVIAGGVALRMHPLADRLFPAVENAGIIATVVQSGSGLLVDVRESETIRRPFSVESGNLVSWEWAEDDPTVTYVVGGGQGEGVARRFMSGVDTSRETSYGERLEAFVDARDAENDTDLQGRIQEALLEGAAVSGLTLQVASTKGSKYGKHYRAGDMVTVKAPGLQISDRLRSANFSWTRESGLQVVPGVGDRTDDPDLMLAKQVKALKKGMTDLKVR